MYPRINYEMTEEDLKKILKACKPTPVMSFDGINSIGGSQQENANMAWEALGKKMGFDYMTVRPIEGKKMQFFSAVPSETELQREERVKQEAEEKRVTEIKRLEDEITECQNKLNILCKR